MSNKIVSFFGVFLLKRKILSLYQVNICPVLSEYFAHGPDGPRFLLLMILE